MQVNSISKLNFGRSLKSSKQLNSTDKSSATAINSTSLVDYMQNMGRINSVVAFKGNNAVDIPKTLDEIKLFESTDKKLVSKVLEKLNIKDIEYSNNNNDSARLYLKGKNFTYNMTLGKTDDENVLSGLVSKEYDNGKNELYLARLEFIDTNKSKKMQVSFMPVVQMGLDENSKVKPKNVRELSGEITGKQEGKEKVIEWEKTGSASGGFALLGGLLGGGAYSSSSFSPSKIDKKATNQISVSLQLTNSDARKNTTYSVDKETDKLTATGAIIGGNAVSSTKHKDWITVEGPHGRMFEVPKGINLTPEGLAPSTVKGIIFGSLNEEVTYLRGNDIKGVVTIKDSMISPILDKTISQEEDLKNLIDVLTRELNGCPYECTTYYNELVVKDMIPSCAKNVSNLIEVSQEMLKAEREYQANNQ